MGKIYIITNFSSNTHIRGGPRLEPYVRLDNRSLPIQDSLIEFRAYGKHTLCFGYILHYHVWDSVKREHLRQRLDLDGEDHWYQVPFHIFWCPYQMPFHMEGHGRLKEISQSRYYWLKRSAFLWHVLEFLSILLFLLFAFFALFIIK